MQFSRLNIEPSYQRSSHPELDFQTCSVCERHLALKHSQWCQNCWNAYAPVWICASLDCLSVKRGGRDATHGPEEWVWSRGMMFHREGCCAEFSWKTIRKRTQQIYPPESLVIFSDYQTHFKKCNTCFEAEGSLTLYGDLALKYPHATEEDYRAKIKFRCFEGQKFFQKIMDLLGQPELDFNYHLVETPTSK